MTQDVRIDGDGFTFDGSATPEEIEALRFMFGAPAPTGNSAVMQWNPRRRNRFGSWFRRTVLRRRNQVSAYTIEYGDANRSRSVTRTFNP